MSLPRILWNRLVSAVGADSISDDVYRELLRSYGTSTRAYHTISHVVESVLLLRGETASFLSGCGGVSAEGALRIELALWFHDAVYEPTRKDNERRSAVLAGSRCRAMGLSEETADEVAGLVVATAHFEGTHLEGTDDGDASADVIRDIDLAILGAPAAAFRYYENGIRREYAHLSDGEYADRRSAVCRHFLSRASLYRTAHFRSRYELRARVNMRNTLRRLGYQR